MNAVLITGAAGFIGSYTTKKLLNNNYKVIVVDNLSTGSRNNIPFNENLKFYELNIETDDIEFIFKEENIDFVIHLAAQTNVIESVNNPLHDAKLNILSSINLIELSKKYKVKKFIAASTAAVYGKPKYIPIDEKHPTEPISPYGLSKLTMEKYIQMSDIPYIIFRFSNAYGIKRNSPKESGVVTIFENAMINNQDINIYGNGEQLRDFIYVEDIADIFVNMLKSNVKNEIFNFSTNEGITINQLFEEMKKIYNYEKIQNYLPERDEEIKESILSNEKIMKYFPNLKYYSLAEGIQKLRNDK